MGGRAVSKWRCPLRQSDDIDLVFQGTKVGVEKKRLSLCSLLSNYTTWHFFPLEFPLLIFDSKYCIGLSHPEMIILAFANTLRREKMVWAVFFKIYLHFLSLVHLWLFWIPSHEVNTFWNGILWLQMLVNLLSFCGDLFALGKYSGCLLKSLECFCCTLTQCSLPVSLLTLWSTK